MNQAGFKNVRSMKILGHNNIYMNFLKSFIENTKTDNKVTLNDS